MTGMIFFMFVFVGPEDETEDATGTTYQLPSDPQEVRQKSRNCNCSSLGTSKSESGYGTASLCGSAQGKRPHF